jgi:uncharacterized SAM-binding protein YcdF (DUF218 family)
LRLPAPRGLLEDLRTLLNVYRGGPLSRAPDEGYLFTEVAVVLGAQVLPGERASRTLEARVRHAARLYAEGRVRLILPTGGLGEHPPSEAEVMARILQRQGVPENAILLEDLALNTWDSARLVAKLARGLGIARVLVVTDPLHCVRAVAAFREAGLIARAEPVYSSPMWREKWSRRGQLVREIGALVWYRTRHGVGSRSRP